jgi:hypothetical protein
VHTPPLPDRACLQGQPGAPASRTLRRTRADWDPLGRLHVGVVRHLVAPYGNHSGPRVADPALRPGGRGPRIRRNFHFDDRLPFPVRAVGVRKVAHRNRWGVDPFDRFPSWTVPRLLLPDGSLGRAGPVYHPGFQAVQWDPHRHVVGPFLVDPRLPVERLVRRVELRVAE